LEIKLLAKREDLNHQLSRTLKTGSNDSDEGLRTDHLLPDLGERTARGGLIMIGAHGFKFAIGIVGTAIMARLLTPSDYGLIGMVAVVTNFVSLFKDLGLSFPTVQRAEVKFDQVSTLFWINAGVSLVAAVTVAALAPGIAWFYGEPRLTMVAVALGLGFVFGGLAVQHEALLRRQMRFVALSAIALASIITGYAVGMIFAFNGHGYWSLVYSQWALLSANLVGVFLVCRWRPGVPKLTSGTRSMLEFGGNITAYSVINYFSRNSDILLVGRFWGAQQLGFYSKAGQLAALPSDQVDEPLASVAIPALSRLVGADDRYRQAYLRMLEKVMLLTLPPLTWMIVTADWLVELILGRHWDYTGTILVFVGIGVLLQPVINTFGWLFISQGRSRDMLHWAAVNAPISLLTILVGLPWGAAGVAASFGFGRLLVVTPVSYWIVGRSGPVRTSDLFRCTAPFLLAAISSALGVLTFRTLELVANPIVGLTLAAAIITTIMLSVLLLIPSSRNALKDIRRICLLLWSTRLRTPAVGIE